MGQVSASDVRSNLPDDAFKNMASSSSRPKSVSKPITSHNAGTRFMNQSGIQKAPIPNIQRVDKTGNENYQTGSDQDFILLLVNQQVDPGAFLQSETAQIHRIGDIFAA